MRVCHAVVPGSAFSIWTGVGARTSGEDPRDADAGRQPHSSATAAAVTITLANPPTVLRQPGRGHKGCRWIVPALFGSTVGRFGSH
jgi:hypothetical protein